MESELVAKLILGDGIIILHIIIVDGFPDCVMHEMNGVRENYEDNVIIRISPMCIFAQTVRDDNPREKCIYTHIDRRNRQVQDSVCVTLIDLGVVFSRLMFMVMWFNST